MNINSTSTGRGIASLISCLATFVLLLCFSTSTVSASPYVFTAGSAESEKIDWTDPVRALAQHETIRIQILFAAEPQYSNVFDPCFTNFSAGDDETYCQDDVATLNGGYDSYDTPGTMSDQVGLQWSIIQGSGLLSAGLFGGASTVNGGNFSTTSNPGGGPTVTYIPGVGDNMVVLRLSAASTNAFCDGESDDVTLFFDTFQEAAITANVNGTDEIVDASSITTNEAQFCAGSIVDLEITNNQSLQNGQQDGAIPKFHWTVVAASGVTGFPAGGVGEAGTFNSAFDALTVVNNTGSSGTVTVSVVTFYDRGMVPNNMIDAGECAGPAVEVIFTVFPQAQATVSVNNGTNNTFCEDETAQFRVTGSPNSTVTYQLDLATGIFGADQMITLGASGTNGGVNGEAADFITVSLVGLGGATPVRIQLTNVEYTAMPNCPRALNFTRDITVVETPEGALTLTDLTDADFCNGEATSLSSDINYTFTTTSGAGTYDLTISEAIGMAVTSINQQVVVGAGGSITLAIPFPATNLNGQTVTYTLTGITEAGSGLTCGGTVTGTPITVIEQPEPEFSFTVNDGSSVLAVSTGNPTSLTVCDNTEVIFSTASVTNSLVSGSVDHIFMDVVSGDTYGFFGSDRTLTEAEVANLTQTLDIPNNAGVQNIQLEFTAFYESDGVAGIGVTECSGQPGTLNIVILPAITATVTTTPLAQQNNAPTNDLVTVCSGDDVDFSINTNITTSGTANVVVDNGPNQVVNIGANGIGTFTLSSVTGPATFTLVDVTSNGCTVEFNESVDVVVEAVPTGSVSVSDADICLDAFSTSIVTFTGMGGATGDYTYTVVGYAPGTMMPNILPTTVSGSSTVNISANQFDYDTPGTYTFYLTRVENNSGLNCGTDYTIGVDAPSATVVVEEVPQMAVSSNNFVTNTPSNVMVDNASATTSDFNNELCSGETVTLTAMAQSNVTSVATTDELYYYITVITDETQTFINGDAFIVAATAGSDMLISQLFTNTSATNPANVSFLALPFYASAGTTPTVADVGGTNDFCFGADLNFGFSVLPTPEADFGSNQTVCYDSPAVIDFTGTPDAEVSVTVLSGTTNAIAGNNLQGGAALQTTGDSDIITLDVSGSAFFTTGNMTGNLELRITQVESADGCVNTDILDVTIVVLPENDAAFTSITAVETCEGSSASLAITGTPDSRVYYTVGTRNDSIDIPASGMVSLITNAMASDSTYTITAVGKTVINQSGNPVTCVNAPTSMNLTVMVDVEVAPNGTIAALEPVCSGTEQPMLTFTQTAGNVTGAETFTLVINGVSYPNITDGLTFDVQATSLTTTTTYNLESITETTFGTLGCEDVVNGTISTTDILVEAIPAVTATVSLDGTPSIVVADPSVAVEFTATVCSGTELDVDLVGTPSAGSSTGDPLAYRIIINDPINMLGFGAGMNDISLTAAQYAIQIAPAFPVMLTNNSGMNPSPALLEVTIIPFYQNTPGGNQLIADSCPGDTVAFTGMVLGEIDADFDSAPQTICEDGTATIDFVGTPNIEISFFDGSQIITVETDTSGDASYTTVALMNTTTYTITGFSTLPGAANQCTRTLFNGPSQTVTVTPTPTLVVDMLASDLEICNDGSAASIALTSNSNNAQVTYSVGGGMTQTFDLTGTSGNLSITGLTADATVNFSLVTTDPNLMPVCPATIGINVMIDVRDLPMPVLTNDGPVCAGDLIGLTFTDTAMDVTGPYRFIIMGPAGATYTGTSTPSGGGRLFTGVVSGTEFTQVDVAGDYFITAIRDLGANPPLTPGGGCAPVADPNGLTTTTLVIDEEPVLNALVASQAGVVGLSQGGINAFNTTVCNGENLGVDFQSTNDVSNSGNPLFGEFTMVSDPSNILTGYLPAENGTVNLAGLDFNQALVNSGTQPATVSFTITPFYENGTTVGLDADECAGRTLSFNVTVLPDLDAEITSPLAGIEVCDGDMVTFTIEGTPNAQVTFSTGALTGLSATSPATIPASGTLTITGTADRSGNPFATLALSEVTLVTMINGVNKTCSEIIISDRDVPINALPTGSLELSDNGPLCAGESVTVIFITSFGVGDYTLVIDGTTYNVTTSSLMSMDSRSNVFTVTPGADQTFELTGITFDDTGCMSVGMPIDDITVLVNDVPAGTVIATDINGTATTATIAGTTASVCTGEGLMLGATFSGGVTTPLGSANYVSVDFSGDGDYFNQGSTSGTIAIPVGDFSAQFSATFQNLTSSVQNASLVVTYYFEETVLFPPSLDAGECVGETVILNIEIQPNPIASDVAATICSDEAVDFDLNAAITNGVTGVSYTYTVTSSDPTITLPARSVPSGANVTAAAGELTNTTVTDQTITLRVTPATGATMNTPGCVGNDFDFVLTIQPESTLDNTLDATVCSQEPIGITLGTIGGTPATSYNLVSVTASTMTNFTPAVGNAVVADGLAADAIELDEFTNYTSFDQTVTYAIAPIAANGCIGDTVDVVATINPEPFVMNLRDTVCSGVRLDVDVIQDLVTNMVGRPGSIRIRRARLAGVTNFFVLDGNDGDDQINFNNNGLQNNPQTHDYEVIRDSLVNLTNGGIDLVYNIEINNIQGCGRNEFTYTLRVVPEATATLDVVGSASFCTGDDITLNAGIMGGSAPTNIQYTYSVLNADTDVQVVLTPSGSSVNVASQAGTASGNATIAVTVSDGATGCTATATQVVTVGVTPIANPIVGPTQPCVNDFAQYRVRDRGNSYSFSLSNPGAGQIITTAVDTSFTILFNSNAGQGPFVLTMTETSPDGCVSVEDLTISLVAQAAADFFFQLNANNVPRQVAFTNNSSGNPVAFSWSFGTNGEFGTSTDEDPLVQFPENMTNPGDPYDVEVTLTVTGTCAPNVASITKTVTINSTSVCDDVVLVTGVNFITFNVEPTDSLTTTVFAGVPGLVQVVGYDGGFPEVFVPGNGSANTLDTIRKGAGYVVIVDQPSTIQACGTPIDPSFKRPLSPGVNYVGYMGNAPVSSDSYFALLNTNPTVDFLVAQTFGNDLPNFAEVYVPGNGSANFQAMRPGRGYLIIVDGAVPIYRGVVAPTESFDFIYGSVSGDGYVAGTSVDVLNAQGEVVGQLLTDANGKFQATPFFGEAGRADGSFVDGLPAGEELSFRYNDEVIKVGITFNGSMAVNEVNLNFTQAPVIVEMPETFSMTLSPNPVGSQAVITVSNNISGEAKVLLMDVNGRVVSILYQTSELPAGETRIPWNEAESLAPGIYSLIVLRDGALVKEATTRVVKQ